MAKLKRVRPPQSFPKQNREAEGANCLSSGLFLDAASVVTLAAVVAATHGIHRGFRGNEYNFFIIRFT